MMVTKKHLATYGIGLFQLKSILSFSSSHRPVSVSNSEVIDKVLGIFHLNFPCTYTIITREYFLQK